MSVVQIASSGDGSPHQVAVIATATPTPTLGEKQALLASAEAIRQAAVAEAILHPENVPQKPPIHYTVPFPHTQPTATPVPVPYGVTCRGEDLAIGSTGQNGAGGTILYYLEIVNVGETPCDLPVITSLEGITAEGQTLFTSDAVFRPCESVFSFCIASVPLPLKPETQIPSPGEALSGGAGIVAAGYLRCDGQCEYVRMSSLVFHFQHDLSVMIPYAVNLRADAELSIWDVHLIP